MKMNIISKCAVLFILILNVMCKGQGKTEWSIIFNPPYVTAVSGVCARISCNFTYPEAAKPIDNIQWRVRNEQDKFEKEIFKWSAKEEKIAENERMEMLEPDLKKNNCSFIMKDIQAEDEQEYAFRVEGKEKYKNTYQPRVKIIIQDGPDLVIPDLSEGVKANLTCSAPFPCPETPPEIKWWKKTRQGEITELKNNITLNISESLYLSTLTLTPTSDLHNATVGCNVSYGNKIISDNRTLEVNYVQTPQILGNNRVKEGGTLNLSCSVESFPPSSKTVWSFRENPEKPLNQTSGQLTIDNVGKEHAGIYDCEITYMKKTLNASFTVDVINATTKTNDSRTSKGGNSYSAAEDFWIEDFMKIVNMQTILTFVGGMGFSAFIFSMILCCWMSCRRGKKQKVATANPDTEINLETIQTVVVKNGTNEQTPLHEEAEDETQTPAAPTTPAAPADEAEQEEADGTAGRETDYASIDYSLLKNREPEEEKETVDTDYAEIKKDRMKSEALEDEDDQTPPPDQKQTEGDEELYSNSQMMKSQERLNHTQN